MLKIGDNLPAFSCQDDKGNVVSQDDFKGKKYCIVFLPKS